MKRLDAAALDLRAIVRPGDTVVVGEAAAEPQTLSEALVAQRAGFGRVNLFLGVGISTTFMPAHHDHLDFSGFCGVVTNRRLLRAGCMDLIPCHFSQVGELFRGGQVKCDVALVQVSPPNERGEYSFGLANDYMRAAIERARVVVAEVNHNVPQTPCERPLLEHEIDFIVETGRPLLEVAPALAGAVEQQIARNVEPFIPDRATLQMGIGALPQAVLALLASRRDLGVHSGMLGDAVVDLMECGAVSNAYKGVDEGVTITGVLIGSKRLYRFVHRNPAFRLCPIAVTHGAAALARVKRLTSINSALEVDLSGQVNSEAFGNDYIGAIGGQVDYVRAAGRSDGGVSIIALPSTAGAGRVSRIVAALSGPVTTARSDVDLIATEHGVAHLRGMSLRQRAHALIAIAAPEHRDTLAAQSAALFERRA